MTPIKSAMLSFGMSGRVFHGPFLHTHSGFELASVWERHEQKAYRVYPNIHSYQTLEALLADDSIELVVVNTPTYCHYEQALAALQAGKHVIVEKAFTTTAAEAASLRDAATKTGKKIAVYQNRRWDSDFLTVRQVIEAGWLGPLNEVSFHFDRYKQALSPKQHKETQNPGAGLLNDLGPHLIDQALCLFGEPEAVFADIRTTRPGSQVDDCFQLLLYYPDFRVELKSGYLVREPLPAYVIHGRWGSFHKTRSDRQEERLLAGETPDAPDWGEEPLSDRGWLHTEFDGKLIREHIPTIKGNYLRFYDGVFNAIRNGSDMPVTAADGLLTMQVIEAARESSRSRKAIPL